MAFSTDAGVEHKNFDTLPEHLIYAAEHGVNSSDVIRSATSQAAQYCKMDHKKGYIRSGYDADYIIGRGNPVDNIENIHHLLEVHIAYISN